MKIELTTKQTVLIAAIIFAAAAAIILIGVFCCGYYQPSRQQAQNMILISQNYRESAGRILENYFLSATAAFDNSGDAAAISRRAKEDLLALVVPKEAKDFHLSAILALTEIESFVRAGKTDLARSRLEELKNAWEKI